MFDPVLASLTSGLPVFLSHLATTLLLLWLGRSLYALLTPHDELKLIREDDNIAAAIAYAGMLIGLAIPLGFCLNSSINLVDILIWGSTVIVAQIVLYLLLDFVLKKTSERIERREIAPALYMASWKIAFGIIFAGAIAG